MFASFLDFDLSFMVWLPLGLLGVALAPFALVGISGVRRRWRTPWGALYGAAQV